MPGFVGIDGERHSAADVVADLAWVPWPIKDSSVDEVRAWHVLEHLPGYSLHDAIWEIYRVLRPGGMLYVKVPYKEKGPYYPYHFRVFNEHSFDAWTTGRVNAWTAQHHLLFQRKAQQVVWQLSGPLTWHSQRKVPRLFNAVTRADERGSYTEYPVHPVRAARELREWLVRV